MAEHSNVWESIGTPSVILSWIRDGVYFPVTQSVPPFFHKQLTHDPAARLYWHTKLRPHYLSSGAIRLVPPPPANNRYISKCFFVPKSSGGYRLVIDLKFINKHFDVQKIKFENLGTLRFA